MTQGENNKVTVHIFGEKHVLRGKGAKEYLRGLAEDVDQRMKEIATKRPQLNHYHIAILTALNLADEISKLKEDQKVLMDMLDEKNDK